MPNGGRITVETSNCKFQPVVGSTATGAMVPVGLPNFPCVLLVVSDNGRGMDATTREHLFDPFFTTKNAGQGTGLGLTTVRTIVTTNRGLIHFESEPGRGTRVMVLLPCASQPADPRVLDSVQDEAQDETPDTDTSPSDSATPPSTPLHKVKKESLL
jgi:signal transduction histidine kinase